MFLRQKMTNWSPSSIGMQGLSAQQAGSHGFRSQYGTTKYAWGLENRGSPSTGSQSFSSEQNMDVDDPLNKDQGMQTLKNTTELLSNLDGLQSLVELSKQELISIKQTPDENAILKDKIERLKIENRELQTHGQDMSTNSRDKEMIENLKQEVKTANEAADKFKEACLDISQKHKEELAKTQALNQTLTENKASMNTMMKEYESRISDLQKLYEKAREEKKKSEADLSESRTRLSRLMGNKLANNNPDIADLSDKNRPTKIAERNQELYDNEWTNAFEVIQEHSHNENKTIGTLFQILQDTKRQCDLIAKEQEQKLNEAVQLKRPAPGENLSEHVLKQLKDFRRFTAEVSLPEVTEKCLKAVSYKLYPNILKDSDVQPFFKGCVELCWLMNMQDPPLAFGETPNRKDAFDGNAYKFYTETGPFVDYIVWPALLLEKGGSLLSKGIAQAHGRQQDESNKMKHSESPGRNEAGSSPPGHLQTPNSGQTIDRHISETGIRPRNQYHDQENSTWNRQGQDIQKETFIQSVVSGQNFSRNNKNLSNTTKGLSPEKGLSSDADRKNIGGSQREHVARERPIKPGNNLWQQFKSAVNLYSIEDPYVKEHFGDNYNICKDYYIFVFSENTGTTV